MTTTSPSLPRAETLRPRHHLTPEATWMNDPNGLVLHEGRWHAFFQNNPHGSTWGNLSWGHAVSDDLATWTHLPVALPCSETEMMFSGSVVHDVGNTSGFGTPDGEGPLVALYTSAYTDAHPTLAGIQAQSLAYSLDHGASWSFHTGNPVLTRDSENFRDPKVFFHPESDRWVMVTVEAVDHTVHLHTSADLLDWEDASTFTHPALDGGIWECPDLLRVALPSTEDPEGEAWVLVLSTNPGGPAGGSGTFAVVGEFDGRRFRAAADPQPLDLGPDCYAAVSFSGVDGAPVLMGWMNNWDYAEQTPTDPWRSAMTLPRSLHLETVEDGAPRILQRLIVPEQINTVDLPSSTGTAVLAELDASEPVRLRATLPARIPHRLVLAFEGGERDCTLVLSVGADGAVVLDRSDSHLEEFAPDHTRSLPYVPDPRRESITVELVVDRSCVDLSLDDGRAIVSQQIFPSGRSLSVRAEHGE